MLNPFQIFINIYTKISTMININNFNISNPYVKIMFLVCSKGNHKFYLSSSWAYLLWTTEISETDIHLQWYWV